METKLIDQELLAHLASLRKQLAEAKDRRNAFLQEPTYTLLQGQVNDLTDKVAELTESIRQSAVENYLETGEKNFIPGVKVQVKDIFTIDNKDAAWKWVLEHAQSWMHYDEKILLAHAKAVHKTQPLDFVLRTTETVATIAADLSFLDEAEID